MDKIFLSRTETAAALGISIRFVDLLLGSARLPSVKIGKRRLVPRAAVEDIARLRPEAKAQRQQAVAAIGALR